MISVASYNALLEVRNQQRPFILSRSVFAGSGHYAAHWLGDNWASWDDMKMATPAILTFNLFGNVMVGADICGFGGDTTAELCTRWMQLGSWYPFSRNHNSKGALDQEPFRLGSMVLEASRQALNARMALTLYFYSLYHQAATVGGTVARPLSFEFPDDTSTWSIDTQFMVGPAFMVSPVLESGLDRVEIFFPGGDSGTVWYDYWTGRRVAVSDSRRLSVPAVLGTPMPVHVRGGQIVPRQAGALTTAATVIGNIELLVSLPGASGRVTGQPFGQTNVVRDDGETVLSDPAYAADIFNVVATWSDTTPSGCTGISIEVNPTRTDYDGSVTFSTITIFGFDSEPRSWTLSGASHGAVGSLEWDAENMVATLSLRTLVEDQSLIGISSTAFTVRFSTCPGSPMQSCDIHQLGEACASFSSPQQPSICGTECERLSREAMQTGMGCVLEPRITAVLASVVSGCGH